MPALLTGKQNQQRGMQDSRPREQQRKCREVPRFPITGGWRGSPVASPATVNSAGNTELLSGAALGPPPHCDTLPPRAWLQAGEGGDTGSSMSARWPVAGRGGCGQNVGHQIPYLRNMLGRDSSLSSQSLAPAFAIGGSSSP